MNTFLNSIFLALSVLICVRSEVIELTDSNFEHLTQASTGQTTGKWFIKFYAPWCGHCTNLIPTWEKLAKAIADDYEDEGINIAKVDATAESMVKDRFKVSGFPDLKYFADRKMYNYNGGRTLEDLLEFITEDYKNADSSPIPSEPNWFDKNIGRQVESLREDFFHIVEVRKNAAALLLFLGASFGFLFSIIFLGRLNKRSKIKVD